MSPVEQAIRDAFADPKVDFLSVGRTQQGDYFAAVKRSGRGYGVHYAKDPGDALVKAIAAPAVGDAQKAFTAAKAAFLPPAVQDEFG